MSTPTFRVSALAGALLLAGCQQAPSGAGASNTAAPQRSPVQEVRDWVEGADDSRARIYCGLGADAPITQDCRMEAVDDGDGRTLILSRPDGGFRRARITADGKIAAADGALEARVAGTDRAIGIVFGEERYSVPATALAAAKPR